MVDFELQYNPSGYSLDYIWGMSLASVLRGLVSTSSGVGSADLIPNYNANQWGEYWKISTNYQEKTEGYIISYGGFEMWVG